MNMASQACGSGLCPRFAFYAHLAVCGFGNFCSQEVAFARSTDGGKTFSPVRFIEGHAPFCTNAATGRPANASVCR
jgi:hypothetical protein